MADNPLVVKPIPVTEDSGGATTANQGTAAAIGAPWPVELSDGAAALGTKTNPLSVSSGKTPLRAKIDTASSGSQQIVAANATKATKVCAIALICTGALTLQWLDGATALTGIMSFAANGGYAVSIAPPFDLLETSVNSALNLSLGSGVQVSGHISYWQE